MRTVLPRQANNRFVVHFLAFLAFWLAAVPTFALAAEPLTLKRVVLSTGGVGYFEYEAAVDGDAELSLPVRFEQVDDVLKSIVVARERGGIATIGLAGREPLRQIFRDFPFGTEAFRSPADLLNALQGARVRSVGTQRLEGRLVRVVPEKTQLRGGLGTITRHRVSLLTAQGLQQFVLEDVESIQFADPQLQAQIEAGLAAIAAHRVRDRRVLRIAVKGEGKAKVRVAFVVAAPLWKTTYRLTLAPDTAAAGATDALLQGWALIENMSGEDWNDIELTLVSGNPVTFRQAIYAAYYVDRPEVPVEVFGRILPRPDVGAVARTRREAELRKELRRAPPGSRARAKAAAKDARGLAGAMADVSEAPAGAADEVAQASQSLRASLAAQAKEAATQVLFRLPLPVSVRTGHSLMVPIVDREMPVERLALYQSRTHALHPLATVRLTNDGETGLPPGALTLYERAGAEGVATYVGDAQMNVLPAGERRLVSFALDSKTKIDREVQSRQRISKGKINRGVFELTLLETQTTVYRIKAAAREDRLLLIEHPRRPGWTLVGAAEEDAELTPGLYRIRHRIKRGGEDRVEITLQRPRLKTIRLGGLSTAEFVRYAKTGELDERVRRAFARMAEMRGEIERLQRRVEQLERRQQTVFKDQERIRKNLSRVPRNSDLYRRYLATLDTQENELERRLAAIEATEKELNRARDALSEYIGTLKL